MFKFLNNKKGFTLIEMIIVIAIIGILAVIALPNLQGFTAKAKKAADRTTAESIVTAISVLVADGTIDESVTKITYQKENSNEFEFKAEPDNSKSYDQDIKNLLGKIILKIESGLVFDIANGKVTCTTFEPGT